ncbi:MAG TPA: hypothetical protein VGY56_17350 [Verrucomicrobiae bacterium]|nr:hypothetical protein [Verrucomicrobiae bacterium]
MSDLNQKPNYAPGEEIIRAEQKDKRDKSEPAYSISPELKTVLNLVRLPASLTAAMTAGLLGFKPHEIPILVARGFLQPQGIPRPNSEKFFSRVEIEALANDVKWLSRARAAVNQHWRLKNARKAKGRTQEAQV